MSIVLGIIITDGEGRRNSYKHFLAFATMLYVFIFPLSAQGGDTASINGEINALKVLEAQYGKLTIEYGKPREPAIWRNINLPDDLKKYSSYDKYGEVYVAFEARYKESGIEKYVLVTQTRPDDDQTYECHQCAPPIGGFVFRKSGNLWILESHNKYLGFIGKWGWINKDFSFSHKVTVELIKVGSEKHGVLIRGDDVHQGYENYYVYLIVPQKDALKVSFSNGIEGAGTGACPDLATKNKQGIHFPFDKNDESEFYDITVTRQWNKGPCRKVKSVKETKTYRFADGKYAERRTSQK